MRLRSKNEISDGWKPYGSNMFDIKDPTARKDPAGRPYATNRIRKFGLAFKMIKLYFTDSHSYCTSATALGGTSGFSFIDTIKTIQKIIAMIS